MTPNKALAGGLQDVPRNLRVGAYIYILNRLGALPNWKSLGTRIAPHAVQQFSKLFVKELAYLGSG